ncbi:MAG: hypothetical protein WD355_01310 [Balneolaceae bacterium]
MLRHLGFTREQIQDANDYVCGTMTVEGAPHLKEERLADAVARQDKEKAKKPADTPAAASTSAVAQAEEDTDFETDYDRAKQLGYTGDSCPECGSMTMIRNGTCLKCITCGSTTGCS